MDDAIRLLDENKPHRINVVFELNNGSPSILVRLLHDANGRHHSFTSTQELRHIDKCNRLGAAIGCNTSLRTLQLSGDINEDNNSNNELYQCMEVIYRGLERNRSLETLVVFDMGLLSDDGRPLPTLNLHDAQFKTSLKNFIVKEIINEEQSHMISSFLENVSVESFDMLNVHSGEYSEAAFRRVVLACTKVEKLRVCCKSTSQYLAVASLLRNPRSILSEIDFCFSLQCHVNAEGLATFAAGLASNETLKILHTHGYRGDLSPMAKALCDASSIKGIHASNHTLYEMHILHEMYPTPDLPPMALDCLKLNKIPNKDEVIRKKIARYYFVGDFDISPFANMPVPVLLEVLNLIEGGNINRQSAIFRMLKCIPDLSNVSSRLSGQTDGHKSKESPCKKRLKIST